MNSGPLTHGHARRRNGQKAHPTYVSWASMLNRCRNERTPDFKNYGGRGITVCKRWLRYENFLADMGERLPGQTLERINNDRDYKPSNCRWATKREQARNSRHNTFITFRGRRMLLIDWARELGLKAPTLCFRLKRWSVKKSLTTPLRVWPRKV